MKKILILIVLSVVVAASNAQVNQIFSYFEYETGFNVISITEILKYTKNNGYYQRREGTNVSKIKAKDILSYYAYNKKTNKLYVKTLDGNYEIELRKKEAKYYKERVENLKEKELTEKIKKVNEELTNLFEGTNAELRRQEELRIARAREDSIKKAKEDSIRQVKELAERETYIKEHDFRHVPVNDVKLYCILCNEPITVNDKIFSIAANRDSISWFDTKVGDLGLEYIHVHKAEIPSSLKKYQPYIKHYEAFKDSLDNEYLDTEFLKYRNGDSVLEYMMALRKKAPNGYFVKWFWDNEYSNISFEFTYQNTNKKTIKYIEVFWKVLNDVGDVRKAGSFKGTGPLKEWDAGSWKWDSSMYYVAGDATKMKLTKVIITYMDGSRVILPQNKIMEN